MNKALDYVSIKSEIGNYTNFITKPIALNLFVSKDVRKGILVNFFNLLKRIQKNITNIIDLSYNTGGDERLGKQLIWYLTEKNPRVSLNI
jgi:hypothetical protein